jgi:hypothetical protein
VDSSNIYSLIVASVRYYRRTTLLKESKVVPDYKSSDSTTGFRVFKSLYTGIKSYTLLFKR